MITHFPAKRRQLFSLASIPYLLACLAGLSLLPLSHGKMAPLELKGEWDLGLDASLKEELSQIDFDYKIVLPSTLDEAGIGDANTMEIELKREVMLHLQRKFNFEGKAWYRRQIEVPEFGARTKAILKLERVLWKSTIYLDGKEIGDAKSLATPHEFDLTDHLTPGSHELVICIDNSRQHRLNNKGMAHGYTNETQIKWNGVLGDFAINFLEVPELAELQIDADFDSKSVRVDSRAAVPAGATLELSVLNPSGRVVVSKSFSSEDGTEFPLKLAGEVEPWNEFSPSLYTLKAALRRDGVTVQEHSERFGFRSMGTNGNVITLNGNPIFLRGTLECSIFPLTGHPPLEKEGWLKVYRSAKDYGLNHLRFHSWCPPKAAFEAADEMGMYLQVEPPNWSITFGEDEATAQFIESEAMRMIEAYGNHPSFCFMAMGNELEGDFARLRNLVTDLRTKDSRHLYTTSAFTFQKGHGKAPEPVDDFFITQYTDKGWVRGQGVFDSEYPNFRTDYSDAVRHLEVPLVTHEIGQYSVYPNLDEIKKYTGVLEPKNFKAVKADLEKKGLLHLADDYLMASGTLAKILYKEEIERALKTEGISGFQLLDLHDFPGQGTALVGLLDAFWDSKGIVGPEEFKTFCSELVPLIWMEKAVYDNTEAIRLEYGVANHFKSLKGQAIRMELRNSRGKLIQSMNTKVPAIEVGETSKLGTATFDLSAVKSPEQLTLSLSLKGTEFRNRWQVWVYPKSEKLNTPEGVFVTSSLDEAKAALKTGGKVLLSPDPETLTGVEGKFVQVFWSPVHFPDQPGTMGLLMDPRHEAFQSFPTESHTNWQWWDLCKSSKTLEFGDLPIDPVVRVVDNFFKNRNLTNLFEARVGKGKLLFSSIDLISDLDSRLEAKQLRQSLQDYMASDSFDPKSELSVDQLGSLFQE